MYELDSHANVIWGARVRKDYESKVRCMAIMTGIKSAQIMGPKGERETSRASPPVLAEKPRVAAVRGVRGVNGGGSIIDQIV